MDRNPRVLPSRSGRHDPAQAEDWQLRGSKALAAFALREGAASVTALALDGSPFGRSAPGDKVHSDLIAIPSRELLQSGPSQDRGYLSFPPLKRDWREQLLEPASPLGLIVTLPTDSVENLTGRRSASEVHRGLLPFMRIRSRVAVT